MNQEKTPLALALLTATSAALFGCAAADVGASGPGGTDGTGDPKIRFAHLAPEIPTADDPAVDFFIEDEGSFPDLAFGEVTPYVFLEPTSYFIDIFAAGGDELLATLDPTLELGDVYTVVTYRDSTEAGQMGVFLIDERTDGLQFFNTRLALAHGVDDSTWQTVNVVDADTEEPIAEELGFGSQSDPMDLPSGELDFGFDISPPTPEIDVGPFRASMPDDSAVILVAVDKDTIDGSVDAAVYAFDPTTRGTISQLSPPP